MQREDASLAFGFVAGRGPRFRWPGIFHGGIGQRLFSPVF
jgi:hypothetical protein